MSARDSLQTAIMRPGDFHLRRGDRQLFGNYVLLSPIGGTPGPVVNARRSAAFVETPVYDAPKLWRVEVLFSTPLSSPSSPLSPWLPAGSPMIMRVRVRHALDRDKQVAEDVFDVTPLTAVSAGGLNTFPTQVFAAQQLAVYVDHLGPSLQPVGVQVSAVEITADERDPYGSSIITSFAQSGASQNFLLPNARRRQFFVQNWGSSPLYVAFSFFAGLPGVTNHWTVALPNRGDVYESPRDCWQGYVSGIWAAAGGANDQAMVTEGF